MRRRVCAVALAVVLVGASCGDDSGDDGIFGATSEGGLTLVGPPETDAGDVPLFEWESLEGAASYQLAVVGPSGFPIWAWEGESTSVYLGGLSVERPPGMRGPVVLAGSVWSVAGLDPDGAVIALSNERPVSPSSDSTPEEPSAVDETTAPEPPADIPDPCAIADPSLINAAVGPGGQGEPSELVVDGDLLGRKCVWFGSGFSPALTVGIYFGGVGSFVDRCDVCEPRSTPGESAWGGVAEIASGRFIGSLFADAGGLAFTAETDGVDASLGPLDALLAALIDIAAG